MTVWLGEIWHAWRANLRKPGFLALASVVLALGVGAMAAVLTLIGDVLLQPLPYAEPARLVAVGPMPKTEVRMISPEQYRHLRGLAALRSMALYAAHSPTMNVVSNGTPEVVAALRGDRHLLPTLGIDTALGRNFSAEEDSPNGPRAVILGYRFWQQRFEGRPDVIGSTLRAEGAAYTIVGVLPEDFRNPGVKGDIMLPAALPEDSDEGRNYRLVARLADGITPAEASAQIHARLHALYEARNDTDWLNVAFVARDLQDTLQTRDRQVLMMFLGSAALLLLIAVVNLVNLMLLRALARSHDTAVRSALGAPRLRLALPSLAEGLLVGICGALLGMGLATAGIALLRGVMPAQWLANGGLQMGWASWLLALLLSVAGALLATLPGLLRGHGPGAIDTLREGGRSGIGRHGGRLGRMLVVVQVAMATALLSCAGLFLHTLHDLSKVPLGFSSRGILTFELSPVAATYPDTASVHAMAQRLVERLQLLPGVAQASATTNLPAGGPLGRFMVGDLRQPAGAEFAAEYRGIEPGFFDLFGIRMLDGRAFGRSDVAGGEPVAIVNRALAEAQYGGQALGKKIQRGEGASLWTARIVGVVADTRQFGPAGAAPEMVYLPLAQVQDEVMLAFRRLEPLRFALKVNGAPDAYRDRVIKAVAEVAPEQPISGMHAMDDVVRDTTADLRINLMLVGVFAVLALLLAASGLYAVMAVSVAAREREFAVRLALGSSPARLLRLVVRSGMAQIVVGLACGVGLAIALPRVFSTVATTLGTSAPDPVSLAGVCATLAAAGLLACLPAAWKAARVQPMRALRGE
ncbi:ADOP family duplicated permease [Massilia consociata]|uniref:ADOP family duplicated permease n=1 Tax=Massilia consociata TaxID=760117 RepID=A0ABV6FJP1_9BURK